MASTAEVYMVSSGDCRLPANQDCWPVQKIMEDKLVAAFAKKGAKVIKAHPYDEKLKHGFIWNQRMGMNVLASIPANAHVVVAESVWQYSQHLMAGLRSHKGKILTVANWDGTWPGLVGLLNLNASLTKASIKYSSTWSVSFDDDFFMNSIDNWLKTGTINHDLSHVRDVDFSKLDGKSVELGKTLGAELLQKKIFDEGCMGMYNAFFDDELLNPCGIYKERLSQSALFFEMTQVSDDIANKVLDWIKNAGMKFEYGTNPLTELLPEMTVEQCKMYVAAVLLAKKWSLDVLGIQYQLGLKDTCAASDLAEGLLNNRERPPVYDPETGEELFAGSPVVCFNEVDEGCAVDALVTNRVFTAMGMDPSTTLHDIRWGEDFRFSDGDKFVWVFEISGSVPPNHLIGGYKGSISQRQPPMYFPKGGGSLTGISKPGEIVWSRVFIMDNKLHADLGRATVVELPEEEIQRRSKLTTPVWPMMFAVLKGVSRDQMMARHKSNHIQVVYADDCQKADAALAAKAAMFAEIGIIPHLCGV